MPLVRLETNAEMVPEAEATLIAALSQTVAAALGKPERYVMVSVAPPVRMLFAGEAAPAAFLDVRSIGLSDEQATSLAKNLSDLVAAHTGVAADRIYANFTDMPRQRWGWNASTF